MPQSEFVPSALMTLPMKLIGQCGALLPVYPGSLLFVAGLNLALARYFSEDTRLLLAGKKCRILVTDLRVSFWFEWSDKGFSACRESTEADLMIAASAADFFLLAQRKEDPDTLFFSRRLVMEGDTELGLLIKNTLDAIDAPQFTLKELAPWRMLARLNNR